MLKSTFDSFLFLSCNRPYIVMATGSFGSVPAGVSAFFLRIPLFIHEQNIVSGKANVFLGKFATKIFLAFPNSFFPNSKSVLVGNPVGKHKSNLDKRECYKKLELDINKKTLLVFGGSQGASSLNSWFINVLGEISNFNDWQIIHITGKSDYVRVKNRYVNFKIRSVVLPFLYPIDCAYKISDLAVSRGGALSLSELSFWGISALIVPYSYAKDNHQEYNARYFQERGGVYLLKQEDIKEDNFPENFKELLNDSDKLKLMSKNMKDILQNDALERICEEIYKYIK